MPTTGGVGFIGRVHERERLDAMLAQARDGQSAVVVIRGQPGIGKTALLRYAARQASGLRTTEVEGIQAEMELPFAGDPSAGSPMLDGIEVLPEPQQNALQVALGVASGDVPAGSWFPSLYSTSSGRPPSSARSCAWWMTLSGSTPSVGALGFVARRLVAEPMVMIFSLREPVTTRALDGLRSCRSKASRSPMRALCCREPCWPGSTIASAIGSSSKPGVIRLRAGRAVAEDEPVRASRGLCSPLAAGDLPSRLEERYLQRVAGLPEATQRLMLLAAAEPLGDATLLWRAAERLFTDPGALAPAREARLLEIDDRVRFHHPLVRSAVYRAASPDERRRVHDVLAEVSDHQLAADRRAWHRALAAAEPDEAVAADLERSAGRAQGRGGLAAAAAFLERATALTPDPALQAGRALAAAAASFQAGDFDLRSGSWRQQKAVRSTASSAPKPGSCRATLPSCPSTATRRPRCSSKPRDASSRSTSASRAGPT